MLPIEIALFAIIIFSWIHWLISLECVRRLVRRAAGSESSFRPPVTILKPLKGIDADLYENLASFCRQDYPSYELLIGTRDADDPALKVVQKLQQRFPDVTIRTFVAPDLGLNPKSAILHELTRRAQHDLLVISDSDVRVGRDYLSRVVAPLADSSVGLVTCVYRSRWANTLSAILGALHVDLSFLPSAVVGSMLPNVQYAFGATLALRRSQLLANGGYASIADHLADDFQVAAKLHEAGLSVRLSDCLVTHVVGDESVGAFLNRQVRWARTIRVSAPVQYLGVGLTFSTPWSIVLLLVSGFAAWSWVVLLMSMLLRWIVASSLCELLDNRPLRRELGWLVIADCLDSAIWCIGLFGSQVDWRGTRYRLDGDGRMSRLATAAGGKRPSWIAQVVQPWVRRLDAGLRRRDGIFEYTEDPQCIFRAQIRRADKAIELSNGTTVAPGDRIIELHLWNEQVPPMRRGAMMGWSRRLGRQSFQSLALLDTYLQGRPGLEDIKAVYARAAFAPRNERQVRRLVERLGFEFHGFLPAHTIAEKLHRAGENLLVWALIWTFNSRASHGKIAGRPRYDLWMSRRALHKRYGRRKVERANPGQHQAREWSSPPHAQPNVTRPGAIEGRT